MRMVTVAPRAAYITIYPYFVKLIYNLVYLATPFPLIPWTLMPNALLIEPESYSLF